MISMARQHGNISDFDDSRRVRIAVGDGCIAKCDNRRLSLITSQSIHRQQQQQQRRPSGFQRSITMNAIQRRKHIQFISSSSSSSPHNDASPMMFAASTTQRASFIAQSNGGEHKQQQQIYDHLFCNTSNNMNNRNRIKLNLLQQHLHKCTINKENGPNTKVQQMTMTNSESSIYNLPIYHITQSQESQLSPNSEESRTTTTTTSSSIESITMLNHNHSHNHHHHHHHHNKYEYQDEEEQDQQSQPPIPQPRSVYMNYSSSNEISNMIQQQQHQEDQNTRQQQQKHLHSNSFDDSQHSRQQQRLQRNVQSVDDSIIHHPTNTTIPETYESIHDDELERRRVSRGRVIDELIQTEIDFYRCMKLVYDVYIGPYSDQTVESNIKQTLFCNLKDICDISYELLNSLELNSLNKSFDEVTIGICFINITQSIKQIYAHYAQYIDHSSSMMLDKNNGTCVHKYIDNGLVIIKQEINNVFDLHSLLLKPIQRILKYPLLLQELLKFTEMAHVDYNNLQQGLNSMQDVAAYVNEIKRRRDLILKYTGRRRRRVRGGSSSGCGGGSGGGDGSLNGDNTSTISDKMSKLTIHSMIKKSNRISMKLSNALRLNNATNITVDEEFNKMEIKFHRLEKLLKTFTKDALQNLSNIKESLNAQSVIAETIQEYYGEKRNEHHVNAYVTANTTISQEIYQQNINFIHDKVIKPLNTIQKLLEVPSKLITKRNDKLLDYECARVNADKVKDKSLYKTAEDNLYEAQKTYEALNNQLLEELPILNKNCMNLFKKCLNIYLDTLKNMNDKISISIEQASTTFNEINRNQSEYHQRQDIIQQFTSFAQQQTSSFMMPLTLNTQATTTTQVDNTDSIKTTTHSSCPSSSNSNHSIMTTATTSNHNGGNNLTNIINSSSTLTKAKNTYRTLLTKKNPVVAQIFKTFTNENNSFSFRGSSGSVSRHNYENEPQLQDSNVRLKLEQDYEKDKLYKVLSNYVGFGVSSQFRIQKSDIVAVLKYQDPCGNKSNWFVDNGICKGIIPSSILQIGGSIRDKINITNPNEFNNSSDIKQTTTTTIQPNNSPPRPPQPKLLIKQQPVLSPPITPNKQLSDNSAADSFDEDDDDEVYRMRETHIIKDDASFSLPKQHQYINASVDNPRIEANKSNRIYKVCIAIYKFDALDENTLSINENEKYKVLQSHDDNLNTEWWLVESFETKRIGYIPSNYVNLIEDTELKQQAQVTANSDQEVQGDEDSSLLESSII